MKKLMWFTLLVFFVLNFAKATDDKGVRVQVKHENELVFDTIIYESDEHARILIEDLVMKFSKDSVKLNSENIHGLYVFHIDNDQWKNEQVPSHMSDDEWAKENYSNTDSLLSELELELDGDHWNGITIEMAVDSISEAFDVLGKALREFDYRENPDLVEIKDGFESFLKKVKSTKVVIVTKEDDE